MITLTVTASSSSGNAYALNSDTETLFIEAGRPLRETKRAMGYNTPQPAGVLVTHRHGDHAAHLDTYLREGVTLYANEDVIHAAGDPTDAQTLQDDTATHIGAFKVTPFRVYHDVPAFGFIIQHPEMGAALFATDTFSLPCVFRGINHWLIEANYDDDILKRQLAKGDITKSQHDRILTSHMAFQYTLKALKQGQAEQAETITLIHTSTRHADTARFLQQTQQAFGVPTLIAMPRLTRQLHKPSKTTQQCK